MAETLIFNIASVIGALVALIMLVAFRKFKFPLLRVITGITFVIGAIVGGVAFWYTHRPLPTPEQRTLFEGVEYIRDVQIDPYPVISHIVTIDLRASGLSFLVTPRDTIEGFDHTARTTSQFLDEFDTQIAINGDFFDPWHEYGPFDYYPHVGDGVNTRGISATNGEVQTQGYSENFHTLMISEDNQVSFGTPADTPLYTTISGYLRIVQNGVYVAEERITPYMSQRHPRTAVALDQSGETMIIVVVDGRQPNYSEGMTLPELAQVLIDHGGYTALNLDGGGSSTMVIEGENGQPIVLNSPIHTRIPGAERPNGNHLGIFARRLD